MFKRFNLTLVGASFLTWALLVGHGFAATITLRNSNIASNYVVTSMPMEKAPACPMVGSIKFFPGGTLTGNFVTDMARSKSIPFSGSYTLTGGANITFSSDSPQIPLKNLNGIIARSGKVTFTKNAQENRKNPPPVEHLVITANTEQCSGGVYKLTLAE
jgi:hypothetical protein